jgi:hydroxymethylpyrimidine/phosphomethylpyrimidine kinase
VPRKSPSHDLSVALTVAGSDSGAGAGIQADLLTFAALGVFGTTAITSLTAQNPAGVSGVHAVPPEFVAEQIRQITAYFPVRALKTGMLFNAAIIEVVADFLAKQRRVLAVVDPVMVASSGALLLQPEAVNALRTSLLPMAALVTPNLDEAAVLLGRRPEGVTETIEAARGLAAHFSVPFLLKGGHLPGERIVDVLARPRGRPVVWRSRRIRDVDTHGSGCTLSAAIAALLARGERLEDAVEGARRYLRRGMRRPIAVAGRRFIAHG